MIKEYIHKQDLAGIFFVNRKKKKIKREESGRGIGEGMANFLFSSSQQEKYW